MPALIITAVDNTTDTITSVAHGRVTGDGAAVIFALVGGAIPAGLTGVTDYWIIRVDADHVKLASSSANALSNTPVNITSNGTLPLSLGIGLPYRVPRVAAPGSQVFSADDNSTWQALVALWNFFTGQAQSTWTNIRQRTVKMPALGCVLFGGAVQGGSGSVSMLGTARGYQWCIPSLDGDTITSVSTDVVPGAAGTVTLQLFLLTPNVSFAQVGATITSVGTGLQTLTLSGLNILISAADRLTYILVVTQTAGAAGAGSVVALTKVPS